jgi:hypothetical protein
MKASKKPPRGPNRRTLLLANAMLGKSVADLPRWILEEPPRKFLIALRVIRDVRARTWRS